VGVFPSMDALVTGRAWFGTFNGCHSGYCPHFIVLAILTVVAAAIEAAAPRWNSETTK
jgi:hypothetical protein